MIYSRRFRFVCQALAFLFLVMALVQVLLAASTLASPLNGAITLDCGSCVVERDPVRLLPTEEARIKAWRSAGADERILAHVRQVSVRAKLFVAQMLRALPFFVLFAGLAIAVHGFGKAGLNFSSVQWLRRSGLAGLIWVLMEPVALSIRMTAMSPITHGRELNHIAIGGNGFFLALMVAGAVWVCLRVMEEAFRLRSDLEEFV
jgi:hypothetical protein